MTKDGSLLVREDITFDYFGEFQGAYRDIPLRTGESVDLVQVSEDGRKYGPGGNTELGSTDTPGKFGVERSSSRVRIVWHYRARTEVRTFTITYRFRGLAVAYDDIVDVYFQAWGKHWPVPLGRLDSTITLPESAALDERYRVYGHPRWVHGVVARQPGAATLKAVNVSSGQFVEFRVTFPRSLLTSTRGAKVVDGPGLQKVIREEADDQRQFERDREKFADVRRDPWKYVLYLALLGLGPAIALILLTWFLFGRERRTGYDREYEQEPPTETKPALVPPLLRQEQTPGSLEWTATLFDLIRTGRFTAAPVTTERKTWGGLKTEQVADLELSQGNVGLHLEDHEQAVAAVVDDVLDEGSERLTNFRKKIEAHRSTNAPRFSRFKKDVGEAIARQKWFSNDGAKLLGAGVVAAIVAAVLLLWLAIDGWNSLAPRWTDAVLAALGGCAIANGVILIVASSRVRLWRRRTRSGQEEAERWDAFRRYLTDFPRLDEAPPATLELWERYLVFGISFGIAERVLQAAHLHMPEELHNASTIYWISPSSDLGSGASALAIGDLSSGFGSALSPPSSGGGGGFSGGGGGGGGGGAW